ncbi:MAG: ATP-binding protein [Bacteroidota bacterium]
MVGPVVNRESELARLHALADAGGHRLALVTGRRRVGKTYLLTNAWGDRDAFFFTASKTTPELNRRQLVEAAATWAGEDLRPEDYPTWRTVFQMLVRLKAPRPLVVVLDEFQYLGDGASGAVEVASELNAVWEAPRPERSFLMVLSGSAVGTMGALAAGGGPLYGRFQWQGTLRPFGYWHAAELAGVSDLRERALAYGIFGGTPRYLAAIDPDRSVAESATRLVLDPGGEVRLLVETALEQEEGLRDVAKYRAVLHAVASGQTKRNEIADRAGLPVDGALRDKLRRLVGLGYLEARRNVDARPNAPARYGVADAAFRFYERFVGPNRSRLERLPAEQVWAESVAPHLDVYMGHEFERVAAEAYDRRAASMDLPTVAEWGRWEGTDRDRQPVEVDIVAPLVDRGVLTGEVKWNREPVGTRVHAAHLDKLRRMADAGRAWAHGALGKDGVLLYVSASGFEDGFRERIEADGRRAVCWSLDDLYAE